MSDRLAAAACLLALAASLAGLAAIVGFVAWGAAPAVSGTPGPWGLLADAWSPLAEPVCLGLGHAILSTLWVTAVAVVFAVPLGLGVGVFASEVAPAAVRRALLPLLAGVPSVVYGFVGYVTLVAWAEQAFGAATGESLLVAGVVLGVMILPFVACTAAEALLAVPRELRESAVALGVGRWHLVSRIVMRKALPGLFAAVALGLSRAVGETLAVLMLAGNTAATPRTPLERGQPLTALIATELGEAGLGDAKTHVLMAAGLVLLGVVLLLNTAVWTLKARLVSRG